MRKPGTHERFILYREGRTVAEGIEFSDGSVTFRWCTEEKPRSTVDYASITEVEEVQGAVPDTQIIWDF
jgi:hypothetical protein